MESQKIYCNKGHCYDDSVETELDALFDKGNIVDEIQHDLIKGSI